jgi:C1A family cysteine protease
MRIVMYKAGSVPPLPSRLWIYRTARETHHEGDLDNGTYISAAFKVMRELGWTSETTHPWREDNVNNPIGYGLRLHANDQKTAAREYALINGYKDGIKDALSTGYPIVFGVRVDSAFLDVTSRNPVEITGDPIGGHAMCAIGYNKGGVLLVNSWGTGWGDHGIGCIGWSTFLSKCVDLRAVELCARATS